MIYYKKPFQEADTRRLGADMHRLEADVHHLEVHEEVLEGHIYHSPHS